MIKISELRSREVINVLDGKRLGLIKDIDLNVEEGRITSIILPGPTRLLNLFSRRDNIEIPWERIVRIGRDVILVENNGFGEPGRSNRGSRPLFDITDDKK
ncbi:MAG: YlmC/YmxH family sporulation protein [Solirubrobacterales bacterium]